MATHVSATVRETPHATETTNTNNYISDAIRRRAQSIIKDQSIDAESRAVIRYGLETNDQWLPELVRRVDAGEVIIDNFNWPRLLIDEAVSSEKKIEALAEIICRDGDEVAIKSAALLVLMATLENAAHPKALARTAKHLAFTRCGELNLHDMVDAQVAVFEDELLTAIH